MISLIWITHEINPKGLHGEFMVEFPYGYGSEFGKLKLPFTMSEYEKRMKNVRKSMGQKDIDVLVISNNLNNYYLTGMFTPFVAGSLQTLIIWDGEPIDVVRYLEEPGARATSWVKNWVTYPDKGPTSPFDPLGVTVETIKGQKLDMKRIGFEYGYLSFSSVERLRKLLPDAEIKDGSGIVENLRLIKSEAEIEYMRKASRITDKALKAAIDSLEVGKTENDALSEAYRTYVCNGSERPDVMIAFGPHSWLAHLNFFGEAARKLERGDVVFMEMGGFCAAYAGTMARTAAMGEPSPTVKKIAEGIIEGLTAGIEAVKPGVTSGEIDKIIRTRINKTGYGKYWRHRTGYSLGINWYEGDIMSIREGDPSVLKRGMAFHFIPACFVPDIGGIVFSENVHVTEDGHEIHGKLERELFIR
jgi:Xaa-Pro dipeptidase